MYDFWAGQSFTLMLHNEVHKGSESAAFCKVLENQKEH